MTAIPIPAPMPAGHVGGSALIASVDRELCRAAVERLEGRCSEVHLAEGGAAALAQLERRDWRFLFLDRKLPDLDAEEVRGVVAARFPGVEVVMIESDPAGATADGFEEGATKIPTGLRYGAPAGNDAALPGMIGESAAMRELYRRARLVAARATTVLISGPTGCGKELVARGLHGLSPRARKPLVTVNCAAIPDALVESELFGHARGAFTGAVQAHAGRIAAAHGGTLFLDEVGDLSLAAQAKLLRFLELREVQRLGANEVFTVDVRVVAASHRDLAEAAGRGEFREDLYYRLAVYPLAVPGLAERREDIARLAEHALQLLAVAARVETPRLDGEARYLLANHGWRGNVRELQHVMERALILAEGATVIGAEHISFAATPSQGGPGRLSATMGQHWDKSSSRAMSASSPTESM